MKPLLDRLDGNAEQLRDLLKLQAADVFQDENIAQLLRQSQHDLPENDRLQLRWLDGDGVKHVIVKRQCGAPASVAQTVFCEVAGDLQEIGSGVAQGFLRCVRGDPDESFLGHVVGKLSAVPVADRTDEPVGVFLATLILGAAVYWFTVGRRAIRPAA